jgi:hypothetical protein
VVSIRRLFRPGVSSAAPPFRDELLSIERLEERAASLAALASCALPPNVSLANRVMLDGTRAGFQNCAVSVEPSNVPQRGVLAFRAREYPRQQRIVALVSHDTAEIRGHLRA